MIKQISNLNKKGNLKIRSFLLDYKEYFNNQNLSIK